MTGMCVCVNSSQHAMNLGDLRRHGLQCANLTEALSKRTVPTVLVSTKCDNPVSSWEVDLDKAELLCSEYHGIEIFQTSTFASETHKRCISVILRNIMMDRRGTSPEYL